jgi:hypothetical protein
LAQDDSLSDEREKSGDFVVSCVIITAKPMKKETKKKKSLFSIRFFHLLCSQLYHTSQILMIQYNHHIILIVNNESDHKTVMKFLNSTLTILKYKLKNDLTI